MKIGLFTFGGGYAMIALIDHECVEKKKWITSDELMDVTVVAESTPGPIAINCATYVGYQQAGFAGGMSATLGVIIPSFVVIYLISLFFNNVLEIAAVNNAFKGVQVAVSLLIAAAAIKMLRHMQRETLPAIILLLSFGAVLMIEALNLNFSTIYIILIAGVIGYLSSLLIKKDEKSRERGRE
jgi:chromate transporter